MRQTPGRVAGILNLADSISLLLLTAGRTEFLRECVESIQRQSRPPLRLVVVNDGPALSREVENRLRSACPRVELGQTSRPQSGQWAAFCKGLEALGETQPFAIVHDDDRLKRDFVETLANFANRQVEPWICSHNLEVFSNKSPETFPILPTENQSFVLKDFKEACLRYSHSFIPFPGTCFGISPKRLLERVREEYREMADVVLLCECARLAKIHFDPRPIYEYRRHEGQVSDRMDHGMEDRLQDYLLETVRGTRVESQMSLILEKRRAERYFSWVWEAGTFRNYSYRKDFSPKWVFRSLRNRKALALRIFGADCLRGLRKGLFG